MVTPTKVIFLVKIGTVNIISPANKRIPLANYRMNEPYIYNPKFP